MKSKSRPSADATRAKILATAEKIFIEKGFSATSLSQIAKQAGINHSLIYHHFEGKAELWRQVKLNIVNNSSSTYLEPINTDCDLSSFIRFLIHTRLSLFKNNPSLSKLIVWQRLEQTQQKDISELMMVAPENWVDAVTDMQKQGKINPKLDPKLMVTYICSSIDGIKKISPEKNKQLAQQYIEMITNSLVAGLTS